MNAAFVVNHRPPATELVRKEELDVDVGWPVIVCRGKHAGKTGKVSLVEYSCVRLLEDETNIEVFPTLSPSRVQLAHEALAGSKKG